MKKLALVIMILALAAPAWGQYAETADETPSGELLFGKGDKAGGILLGLGAVHGAPFGIVLEGEYGLQDNPIALDNMPNALGVGVLFGFSRYSDKIVYGEWDYTNYVLQVNGFWHVDFFKQPKLDTYFKLGVGINVGSVSWDGPIFYNGDESHGGVVADSGFGARYMLNEQVSAVGELGFGMGLLRVGIFMHF